MSALERVRTDAGPSARLVERIARRLGTLSRRGFLARTAVVGSALAVDPKGYVLTPQRAYSTICGPANTAASGYSVLCCTVNKGSTPARRARSPRAGGRRPGPRGAAVATATSSTATPGASRAAPAAPTTTSATGRAGTARAASGSTAPVTSAGTAATPSATASATPTSGAAVGVACRVASCVPPYRWDSCATTALVDNTTAEQGAPCLQGCGAILRGTTSWAPTGPTSAPPSAPSGRSATGRPHVDYRGGSIYWTRRTGARAIHGAARSAWLPSGGPRGPLGYPTAERAVSPERKPWDQRFQQGVVCDSPRPAPAPCTARSAEVGRRSAGAGAGSATRAGQPERPGRARAGAGVRRRPGVGAVGQAGLRGDREGAGPVAGRRCGDRPVGIPDRGRAGPGGRTQRGTFEKGTITVRPS